MRVTFPLIPAASTVTVSVQVSGVEDNGLLTHCDRLLCDFCSSGQCFAFSFLQIPPRDGHPCRSANRSFRFHLAMDTLAVRLIVPLAGSIVDFHHQVIRPPPRVSERRPSRRYAPCLAHHEKNGRSQSTHSGFGIVPLLFTTALRFSNRDVYLSGPSIF